MKRLLVKPFVVLTFVILFIISIASKISSSLFRNVEQFRMIDSHVHVWSDGVPPFTYDAAPPPQLLNSQPGDLLQNMAEAGVRMAIITQPINHKYDHSFIQQIINEKNFKRKLKGICLMNPTLTGCKQSTNIYSS
jgi:predicted TIM-barrel fold metal-dependent hydrolase